MQADSSGESEKSGAGARSQRVLSAEDEFKCILTRQEHIVESTKRTRQLCDSMPDIGKDISSLREWYTIATREDDSVVRHFNSDLYYMHVSYSFCLYNIYYVYKEKSLNNGSKDTSYGVLPDCKDS